MKKNKMFALVLSVVLTSICFVNMFAQDDKKVEKKVRVETIIINDDKNEKISWDTTFNIEDDEQIDIQRFLRKRFPELDSNRLMVEMRMDGKCSELKKLRNAHIARIMEMQSSIYRDEDGKTVKIILDDIDSVFPHKICKELIFSKKDMSKLHESLDSMQYDIQALVEDDLMNKVHMNILRHHNGQNKKYAYVFSDARDFDMHCLPKNHIGFVINDKLKEEDVANLKKSGLKLSEDKLDIDHVYLYSGSDQSFNLKFELKTAGKTFVKIVSKEGEEIYSDKVSQYFPGKYDKQTTLKSDNEGVYYIYVEQNGQTYSCKIRIN